MEEEHARHETWKRGLEHCMESLFKKLEMLIEKHNDDFNYISPWRSYAFAPGVYEEKCLTDKRGDMVCFISMPTLENEMKWHMQGTQCFPLIREKRISLVVPFRIHLKKSLGADKRDMIIQDIIKFQKQGERLLAKHHKLVDKQMLSFVPPDVVSWVKVYKNG